MMATDAFYRYRFMQAQYPGVVASGFRFAFGPAAPRQDVGFAAFVIAQLYLKKNPPPDNTSTADIAAQAARRFPSAGIGNGAIILAAFWLGYEIYASLDGSGVLAFPKDGHATH